MTFWKLSKWLLIFLTCSKLTKWLLNFQVCLLCFYEKILSVQRALKLDLHPHKNFLCIQKIVAFVHFCSLIFVLLVGFCLRCVFVRLKSFCKKIINRLEFALITSCTILLLDIRFNENMATYIPYKKSNNITFIYKPKFQPSICNN